MKYGLVISALLLVAGAAFAMSDLYVSGTWRYRLSVEIETPEGVKTGSAVREVWASASNIRIGFPESTSKTNIKGEAVVVDLGARGVVFALIDWDSYEEVGRTFPYTAAKGVPDRIRHFRSLKPGLKKDLPLDQYPPFVMFKDLNDPKSVTLVKGHRFDADKQEHIPVDAFEALFGPGVRLKSITVEITEDPVTWGIEKWLGWLLKKDGKYNGGYLDGQFAGGGPALSNILHGGNFKTGSRK